MDPAYSYPERLGLAALRFLAVIFLAFTLLFGLFSLLRLQGLRQVQAATSGLWHVSIDSGVDNEQCGDPTAPCQTISYTVIVRASPGDTILVAQGIYPENLKIGKEVTLRGGYVPKGTDWTDRSGETILDGGQAGSGIKFYSASGSALLEGFSVRNGKAEDGAGIYILGAQTTISNCVIYSNTADYSGGGISINWSPADVRLVNLTVMDNRAASDDYGGGIRVGNEAVATMEEVQVIENFAGGGGGISIDNGGWAVIRSSRILSNTGTDWSSAGILVSDEAGLTLEDSEVRGNQHLEDGDGGLRIHGNSRAELRRNQITANTGPGIALTWYSQALIQNNTIADNLGVGLLLDNYVTATVDGNQITHNTYGIGAGSSLVTVTNNVIAAHSGFDADGLTIWSGDVRVINNTLYDNSAEALSIGGGTVLVRNNIMLDNNGGINIFDQATVTSDHNVFWENNFDSDLPFGEGDLVIDPLLTDPDGGDFHLLPGSPCIDTGNPASAPVVDMEGDMRFLDGNLDGVEGVDIGADEFFVFRVLLPLVVR